MLHSTLVPVGRIVLTELREKLDTPALSVRLEPTPCHRSERAGAGVPIAG